jgi:hypothetical protein
VGKIIRGKNTNLQISPDFLTQRATFFQNKILYYYIVNCEDNYLKSGYASLHSLTASTFAGLSLLGSANVDITDIRLVSTVWIGNHLSLVFSKP